MAGWLSGWLVWLSVFGWVGPVMSGWDWFGLVCFVLFGLVGLVGLVDILYIYRY